MKKKYVPLVRYNPHNKIFKWEYDYEIKYIYEDGDNHPPRPRPVVATESLFGHPAKLTEQAAIKAAKKEARKAQERDEQRELEWESA